MSTATEPPLPRNPAQAHRNDALKPYDGFVAKVRSLCADSGIQQALRRGLAKPVDEVPARTHAALLRNELIPDATRGERKRAFYAVAALIAARPRAQRLADTAPGTDTAAPGALPAYAQSTQLDAKASDGTSPVEAPGVAARFRPGGTSLGESLALAVTRQGVEGIKEDGAESRLHLMVRQDIDGMHRMLPAVLRQLGSSGIQADYACLLRDLIAWPYYRDSVATRWLEDFYRALRRAGDDTPGEQRTG